MILFVNIYQHIVSSVWIYRSYKKNIIKICIIVFNELAIHDVEPRNLKVTAFHLFVS